MSEYRYDIRRVREMSFEELSRYLASVVLYPCYNISGHKIEREIDVKSNADALAYDLLDELNSYRSMFVEEVKRALWDGAKGMFGEYYGLNLKTYIGFLQKYVVSDRAKKIHRILVDEAVRWGPKQIESRKEKSQTEIDADTIRYIGQMVGRINEGGSRDDLFPCYAGGDIGKVARDIATYKAPAAYIHEAVRLGMFDEAELMGNTFRSMRLMPY